jgi:hypothetical protein
MPARGEPGEWIGLIGFGKRCFPNNMIREIFFVEFPWERIPFHFKVAWEWNNPWIIPSVFLEKNLIGLG